MIFTDYGEVFVLNFSVMENTVFFYSQKVDGKMIFAWSFELSMIFQDLGNMVFRAVVIILFNMHVCYICTPNVAIKKRSKVFNYYCFIQRCHHKYHFENTVYLVHFDKCIFSFMFLSILVFFFCFWLMVHNGHM